MLALCWPDWATYTPQTERSQLPDLTHHGPNAVKSVCVYVCACAYMCVCPCVCVQRGDGNRYLLTAGGLSPQM